MKIKDHPKTQMVDEFLYSSLLCTSNSIIDIRIDASGAKTITAISHWYFEAEAKTISFLKFRLDSDRDFFRPRGDENECTAEIEAGDDGVVSRR